MFEGIIAFIVILVVYSFIKIIYRLLKIESDGEWHHRHIHKKCGWHEKTYSLYLTTPSICGGCGEINPEMKSVTAKYTFWKGWIFNEQ